MIKASKEQWDLAQHFLSHSKVINPNFEMPFDQMSWANHIRAIEEIEGHSLAEIKLAIDWLFSNEGKWFQKNVPDAYHFRKHFKTIMKQIHSIEPKIEELSAQEKEDQFFEERGNMYVGEKIPLWIIIGAILLIPFNLPLWWKYMFKK